MSHVPGGENKHTSIPDSKDKRPDLKYIITNVPMYKRFFADNSFLSIHHKGRGSSNIPGSKILLSSTISLAG